MENIVLIDKQKCLKDYACIKDCPIGLLEKDPEGYPVPIKGAETFCVDCGHCVAVCSEGALGQRKMRAAECKPIEKHLDVNVEQLEQWLRSRRSIRQYKDKPVEPEKIKRLLETAAYAPSGHNAQPARWLVIQDKPEVQRLAGLVVDWMQQVIKTQPELAKSLLLDSVVAAWEQGKDRVLRNAPHLIIGYAPKDERRAPAAIVTAIAYIELAAPSLGLGTCWAGYFFSACQLYEPLQKALALPEGQAVYGAVMLGYPKAKYHRIPLRKPLDVIWR
jgi:nitroreductase/NAD-dependent dihydropyrimidine dehydrogenase PreA subunit